MMGGMPRPYRNPEGSEGATVAVRQAMVDRQADDATAFIEHSAESSNRGQTQG